MRLCTPWGLLKLTNAIIRARMVARSVEVPNARPTNTLIVQTSDVSHARKGTEAFHGM